MKEQLPERGRMSHMVDVSLMSHVDKGERSCGWSEKDAHI